MYLNSTIRIYARAVYPFDKEALCIEMQKKE